MAAITDKFTNASNGTRPAPTTLNAIKTIGASSISCSALTGWPTATAVHFIIYNVTTSGAKVAGSQTDWKGIVSGTTITSLTLKAGTDNGYGIGAVVEAGPTAAWADDVVAGATAEHTVLGVHNATAATTIASLLPTGSVAPTALATAIPANKFSNPYKFSVTSSTAPALTQNVLVKVPFNTRLFDTSSNFDTTLNRFVAPVAGFYQISAGVGVGQSGLASGSAGWSVLQKNGTGIFVSTVTAGTGSGTAIPRPIISALVQLAANDYIELYAISTDITANGRVVDPSGNVTFMTGHLVSTT